jgi:hypothetical protein
VPELPHAAGDRAMNGEPDMTRDPASPAAYPDGLIQAGATETQVTETEVIEAGATEAGATPAARRCLHRRPACVAAGRVSPRARPGP